MVVFSSSKFGPWIVFSAKGLRRGRNESRAEEMKSNDVEVENAEAESTDKAVSNL